MSLNVSLTPELEEFIAAKVKSGLYTTASEVVREGLRLLNQADADREARRAEARVKIEHGWEQTEHSKLLGGPTAIKALGTRREKRRQRRP